MGYDEPLLICMDLQQEFVTPGRPWADPDGEEISEVCEQTIKATREACWTLIHMQLHRGSPMMDGPCLPQSIPGCEPRKGEVVLKRSGVSAYSHPDLDGLLSPYLDPDASKPSCIMIGFSAGTSLTSTLYDAQDRCHNLKLLEEACGSADAGDWSAEHTRALCIKTARELDRSVRKSAFPGILDNIPDRTLERTIRQARLDLTGS